jgi:hypothetical protein
MMKPAERGFFVGYFKKIPVDVQRLMLAFIVFFVAGLASASVMLSLDTDSPGAGAYVDELAGTHLTGVIDMKPYPLLRVPAAEGHAARAIMLSGSGKFGVDDKISPLSGQSVAAAGIFVKRGDLEMLLIGSDNDLKDINPQPSSMPAIAAAEDLGRWRLTGEICDGKCGGGAMRPGTGLAHKACANLCISGGVPPVFVSTAPVDGHIFFLLASSDGGPMPKEMLDKTGVPVVLEGSIEKRDDLLIFKIDRKADGAGT